MTAAKLPTADDIAVAIVAASRELGENPLHHEFGHKRLRSRHYVVHAILHVFPAAQPIKLCRWLQLPAPAHYWANSKSMVIEKKGSCDWWDAAIYDRVIRAVEAACARRAVTKPAKPANPAPAKPILDLPPLPRLETKAERPVFDAGRFAEPPPRPEWPYRSKRALEEELRLAVENTAKAAVAQD